MSLSQNIKKYRLQLNITQEELAARLKVSPQAISKWETGSSCPDCSLLVSLSRALGVSLDEIFENDLVSVDDTAKRAFKTVLQAESGEEFKVAHNIAWQLHRALFLHHCKDKASCSCHEDPHLFSEATSAYVVENDGFTIVSNGKEPFIMLVTEPPEGFGDFINSFDQITEVFAALGSPHTSRALLYLLQYKLDFYFEADYLARECDIPADEIGRVIDDLIKLKMLNRMESTVKGEHRVLYNSYPVHKYIGLYLLAQEIGNNKGYLMTGTPRSKPLLKKERLL